jgi:hypothetical protein
METAKAPCAGLAGSAGGDELADFPPAADWPDGSRSRQRGVLPAQEERAAVSPAATAHGEGVDGRQGHLTPVKRRRRGRDVQESAERQSAGCGAGGAGALVRSRARLLKGRITPALLLRKRLRHSAPARGGYAAAQTLRLTYRRRGGRWRANSISRSTQTAERKARAEVRCSRVAGHPLHPTKQCLPPEPPVPEPPVDTCSAKS